jgi:hypothetical protein
LELDAGEVAEHDGGEMAAGAGAERGVIQFPGMRLGVVDQLLDRMKRRIRRHHQHVLRGRDQHDGVEVLDRIELLARLQRHVDGERLRAEMERIAVGRGLRRRRGADIAAGARTVLDDDVLPPRFGELLREDAPERVDGAAAGKCDQHAHGPVGIALRQCIRAPSRGENGGSDERNGPELKPHGPPRTPPFRANRSRAGVQRKRAYIIRCGKRSVARTEN